MEVKIGIVNIAREVTIEVKQSADEVSASLAAAIKADGLWQLTDDKGRRIIVPTDRLGYIDLGVESVRPVGFGAV